LVVELELELDTYLLYYFERQGVKIHLENLNS